MRSYITVEVVSLFPKKINSDIAKHVKFIDLTEHHIVPIVITVSWC